MNGTPTTDPLRRSRALYCALLLVTIALGLGSRHVHGLPPWLQKEPGDLLYATMVYWLVRSLAPRWTRRRSAVAATASCFAVELSQLHHARWIDAIRANPLGHLVLGSCFSFADLVAYVAGVLLGWAVDAVSMLASRTR